MSINLVSFNTQHCLNYLAQQIQFDCFVDAIRELKADVVGLNEMRGKGPGTGYTDQVKTLAEALGWHWYFAEAIKFKGVNPYGNGLISRYPILSAETVLIPDPPVRRYDGYYETRCVLKAVLDAPGGPLTVLVVHCGLNPDEQENAVSTILSCLEDTRCVLMGDFNMEPQDPLMVPLFQRLTDTAAHLTERTLSFPSDDPTIKIDYIFTTDDLVTTHADIPAMVVSDHRPYFATIE